MSAQLAFSRTVVGETQPVAVRLDADQANLIRQERRYIASASALLWGEHCTECVMPSCYATCAFYSPRQDLRCRRFRDGVQRVRDAHQGIEGFRVAFRRWGKLEAAGRPRTMSPAAGRALAAADGLVSWVLDHAPAPFRARDLAARAWNRIRTSIGEAGGASSRFDAFLIDCVSEAAAERTFTLSIKPATPSGRYFQRHFRLSPGRNRVDFAVEDIRPLVDLEADVLVQIEPVDVGPDDVFVFTCAQFVERRAIPPGAEPGPIAAAAPSDGQPAPKVKCVVWDLDNTLWRGTLIEDGLDRLELNQEALAVIQELDRRGVLNSIASKNNPEDAAAALSHFGVDRYFLAAQIGWAPKSSAIAAIAQRLNIHRNTLLFVDDQPFERAEVEAAHPDVRVRSEADIGALLGLPELDLPVTEEAGRRREMYQVEAQREALFSEQGSSFLDFLRSCRLELAINDVGDANLARVFELSQRTNQLNYAGRALSREDLDQVLSGQAGARRGFVLACSDRFGDYGVIGFAVLDLQRFNVDNFFMSCRVQHKKVDHAFFAWLLRRAAEAGRSSVTVTFRDSGRNQAARQVLVEMGFRADGAEEAFRSPPLGELPDGDIVSVSDLTDPALWSRMANLAVAT